MAYSSLCLCLLYRKYLFSDGNFLYSLVEIKSETYPYLIAFNFNNNSLSHTHYQNVPARYAVFSLISNSVCCFSPSSYVFGVWSYVAYHASGNRICIWHLKCCMIVVPELELVAELELVESLS